MCNNNSKNIKIVENLVTTFTPEQLNNALRGNEFWMNNDSQEAKIVHEAAQLGLVFRQSHTQAHWTQKGIDWCNEPVNKDLIIEVGKKYLLRNGSTVIIEVNDETNMRPFGGTIRLVDGKIDRAAFFNYKGLYNPENGENERDIIREINL